MEDFEGILVLMVLLVAPIIVNRSRRASVTRRMREESGGNGESASAGADRDEYKAPHQPRFLEVDANVKDPDARNAWERRTESVRDRLSGKRWVNIGVGVVYVALVSIAVWLGDATFGDESVETIFFLCGLYFLLAPILRYFYYRGRFAPVFGLGTPVQHPFDMVARAILGPNMEGWFLGVVLVLMFTYGLSAFSEEEGPTPAVGIALCIAVAFHWWAARACMSSSQGDENLVLTVLRVFGQDKTARFTFGGALQFWRHYGTYFTIKDPELVGHEFKYRSWNSAVTVILIIVVGLAVKFALPLVNSETVGAMLGPILGAVAIVAGGAYWRSHASFVGSGAEIERRVERLLKRPRTYGTTFKPLALACYEDTWREAVRQFVSHSNVVLMDLRGFTTENEGCEEEVDYLFDNIAINQIVFLVDGEVDRKPVEKMILDRWEFLQEGSPNDDRLDPVATVFVADDKSELDAQSLLDLLILVAERAAAPDKPVPKYRKN